MAALDGITDYRARGHFAAEIARARGKITELKLQIIQLNQDFGGVPLEVLYDNMKSVVIERNTYGRGVHRFHAGFLDFARHAGFLPRLCQPCSAQTRARSSGSSVTSDRRQGWVTTPKDPEGCVLKERAALTLRSSEGVMPVMTFSAVIGTVAYLGLAILGWGGLAAFFAHPARIALAFVLFVLAGAALKREDRANRWVIVALGILGLLSAYLPAYTDRHDVWTLDGDVVRCVYGVVRHALADQAGRPALEGRISRMLVLCAGVLRSATANLARQGRCGLFRRSVIHGIQRGVLAR